MSVTFSPFQLLPIRKSRTSSTHRTPDEAIALMETVDECQRLSARLRSFNKLSAILEFFLPISKGKLVGGKTSWKEFYLMKRSTRDLVDECVQPKRARISITSEEWRQSGSSASAISDSNSRRARLEYVVGTIDHSDKPWSRFGRDEVAAFKNHILHRFGVKSDGSGLVSGNDTVFYSSDELYFCGVGLPVPDGGWEPMVVDPWVSDEPAHSGHDWKSPNHYTDYYYHWHILNNKKRSKLFLPGVRAVFNIPLVIPSTLVLYGFLYICHMLLATPPPISIYQVERDITELSFERDTNDWTLGNVDYSHDIRLRSFNYALDNVLPFVLRSAILEFLHPILFLRDKGYPPW